MKISALTDVGKVRRLNEDSMVYFASDDYSYAMVADGMGGHCAGELASSMAVEIVRDYIEEYMRDDYDKFQVKEILHRAFLKANEKIYEYSCANDVAMGMGTTATLCMVRGGSVIFAHVGDSRAYMIGGDIVQITRDHSYVQELVKLGQITPEEAKHHPRRNYITRAMGVEPFVRIDTGLREYNGESLLLCSDGLFGEIDDAELLAAARSGDSDCAAHKLMDLAMERGGRDNITVIIMEGECDDAES